MDMPISEIRRIVTGASEAERRTILRDHRARLEARLDEVRRLLEAVDAMTQEEDPMTADVETRVSGWQQVLPRIPVSDIERSIAYYQEVMGFRLAWRHVAGNLAALSSGPTEDLLLVPWMGEGPPPQFSAYVYVEDPDSLCAESREAGAEITHEIESRPSGMRDFTVRDPDGHVFTLGKAEPERLRAAAAQYGLTPEQIRA